jgi:hypothetical protein
MALRCDVSSFTALQGEALPYALIIRVSPAS